MFFFFFFNDTATTEIYTLSLHDALPILPLVTGRLLEIHAIRQHVPLELSQQNTHSQGPPARRDRKSTRLNSSHGYISYAVFCLKKKNNNKIMLQRTTNHNTALDLHQHTT